MRDFLTALKSSSDFGSIKVKPVPLPVLGSNSCTVSLRPPVCLTTGTVPYLKLIIWLKPQGSYLDGIKNKSDDAYIFCASTASNFRLIEALVGYFLAIFSKIT